MDPPNAIPPIQQQLLNAVWEDDVTTTKELIEQGADPSFYVPGVTTPLIIAAIMRNTDMIRLLLDKGADVNAWNEFDQMPLGVLVSPFYFMGDDIQNLKLLLDRGGANPNVMYQGQPFLERVITGFNASEDKKEELVNLLVDYGADPFVPSQNYSPWPIIQGLALYWRYPLIRKAYNTSLGRIEQRKSHEGFARHVKKLQEERARLMEEEKRKKLATIVPILQSTNLPNEMIFKILEFVPEVDLRLLKSQQYKNSRVNQVIDQLLRRIEAAEAQEEEMRYQESVKMLD